VWWLSLITLGIYYLVWYHKIHREIAAAGGNAGLAPAWSQIVPIWSLISVAGTGTRIADLQHLVGAKGTSSAAVAFWSQFWFSSQTRYLQRRLNQVWLQMARTAAPTTGPAI
jgi:hypothetical protein